MHMTKLCAREDLTVVLMVSSFVLALCVGIRPMDLVSILTCQKWERFNSGLHR